MRYALIALHDHPSEQSFGMLAFLVRDSADGSHVFYGCVGGPKNLDLPSSLSVEEFIAGNCRNVEAYGVAFSEPPLGKAAGWLGSAFLEECRRLHVSIPDIPAETTAHTAAQDTRTPGGVFWIEDTPRVYERLDAWLRKAAVVACQNNSHETASLMHWCLPDRIETHAAIVHTAPDPQHRARELRWLWEAWYRDIASEAELEERLVCVAQEILDASPVADEP